MSKKNKGIDSYFDIIPARGKEFRNKFILEPLLKIGSWTGREFISLTTALYMKKGKISPLWNEKDFYFKPYLRDKKMPEWYRKTHTDFDSFFEEMEKSKIFYNQTRDVQRFYCFLFKGIWEEKKLQKKCPWLIATDLENFKEPIMSARESFFLDYLGGVDFINAERKQLISFKTTTRLKKSFLKKIETFWTEKKPLHKKHNYEFDFEKWKGYELQVWWKKNDAMSKKTILKIK